MEIEPSGGIIVSGAMRKSSLYLLLLICSAASAEPANSRQAVYEMLDRLQQLQSEVQQLRGQVEEQSHTIQSLQKRQQIIYTDIDQRLQHIEGDAPADGSQDKDVIQDPSTANLRQREVVEYSSSASPTPPVPVQVSPKSPEDEKKLYQEAYAKLRNGHYRQAANLFNQLIIEFPDGKYADNAQYWLGETYKVNNEFTASRAAFQKVISDYPDSPKVADSMLKLGYIELEQNNKDKGREYLKDVVLRYPGTIAANLASEKLKILDKQ